MSGSYLQRLYRRILNKLRVDDAVIDALLAEDNDRTWIVDDHRLESLKRKLWFIDFIAEGLSSKKSGEEGEIEIFSEWQKRTIILWSKYFNSDRNKYVISFPKLTEGDRSVTAASPSSAINTETASSSFGNEMASGPHEDHQSDDSGYGEEYICVWRKLSFLNAISDETKVAEIRRVADIAKMAYRTVENSPKNEITPIARSQLIDLAIGKLPLHTYQLPFVELIRDGYCAKTFRELAIFIDDELASFRVKSWQRFRGKGRRQKLCYACRSLGHVIANCPNVWMSGSQTPDCQIHRFPS